MARTRIAATLAACLLLAACGNPPSHGYVYSVNYEPPGSYYTPGYWHQSCYGTGTNRTCYSSYDPGYTTYVPPEWQLELCAKPGQPSSSNSCGWRDVDEQTWHSVRLGQWYTTVSS